jgi:hypothetical protein
MRQFCAIHKAEQWCPSHSHGYRWLKEREKIVREGLGSPTRRLPLQKPQGRPKKDISQTLQSMTERPRSQTVKQHIAQSGISAATFYRHLKELREQQTAPVPPLHTVQSTGDISAGQQNQSSEPRAYPVTTQTAVDHGSNVTDPHASSTAPRQDKSVAASGSGSSSHQRQPTTRRENTSVACSTCRRRKAKVSVA